MVYRILPAVLVGILYWYGMELYLCKRENSSNSKTMSNAEDEISLITKEKASWSFLLQKNMCAILEKKSALADFIVLFFLMGAGSILFYLYEFSTLKTMRYFVLMMGIYLIARIDHREMVIPNQILKIMLGIRGAVLILECIVNLNSGYLREIIVAPFLGLIMGSGIFLLCWVITQKGIGAGDVKLFGIIGAYTGAGILFPIIFLSAVFSAVYGILMLCLRKLKWKDSISFGPFAAAGTIIALLMGF